MTVDSLIRIETALGQSIVQLTTKLSEGHLSLTEMGFLIHSAIKGGGNDKKKSIILYMSQGLQMVCEFVENFLQMFYKEVKNKMKKSQKKLK